ncbi:molecular chaperone DnaJ [Geomonas nitrogeniifigens]|uniref:Molecular chaperone DnaJ n=1 Tax=Geomonas diazotrophica TaxID=2843197 RepID=A0ABX8JM44_9BACT|nr:molecular chaperone DnaJ [Geomonas nitrogeniifigens]QWV99425.1 molecular chaperone DnaJ [Geomonas nitrogeniifigens]QXE88601.1 molecular chaperone DnaJ [Geomonas nitrogeniifigens]
MTAHYQQRSSEEVELEQKRAELASLRARHAEAATVLHRLREEIAGFERNYQQTLGRRMAELERLEAEIARASGAYVPEDAEGDEDEGSGPSHDDDFRDAQTYQSGTSFRGEGQAHGRVWKSDPLDIKALYREVAKAIHPDLAGEGAGSLRHELMLKANKAYAEDDHRALREILRSWRRHFPEQAEQSDLRAELSRLKKQIAVEVEAIREIHEQIEQLRGSYVHRFKLRVDESAAAGSDLFADLVAAAEINIARAQRRLAALLGEKGRGRMQGAARQGRVVSFPDDQPCGSLYLRELHSVSFNAWKKAGPAIGAVQVGLDQALRLDVKEGASRKLKLLNGLRPEDLQSLFLYDVCDADLDSIVHLSGLEELYLYGPELTDAALLSISTLANLKRIYLYQTRISDRGLVYLQGMQGLQGLTSSGNSITDEGLAVFQQAIPGVKTVSFKWRR